MTRFRSKAAAAFGVALALGMLIAAPADARRGGSFGSRGARTYSAPRPTSTAPGYVPPVQRTMTPNTGAPNGGFNPGGAYAPRPGYPGYAGGYGNRFGGFGGGFLGGLVTGGLIGGMMGHGWGGGYGGGGGWGGGAGGGLLTVLIQLLVLGLILSFVVRMFRRRSPAYASAFAGPDAYQEPQGFGGGFGGPFGGGGPQPMGTAVPTGGPAWEMPITAADQSAFEQLLRDVQGAFAREDYGALREHCTPEVMGYLAEELSDNATHGRKNDVSQLRLLQADVGEAWREGPTDYATASMRYESIDVMRDRASGKVLTGDPDTPSQTTELWTFARPQGGTWKLSAIQEA